MAASTVKMNGSWGRMALALVLSTLLLHGCVVCDNEGVTPAASPEDTAAVVAATDAIPAQAVPTVAVPTDAVSTVAVPANAVSTVAVPANAVPTVTVQAGAIPADAPTMATTDKSQEDNPTTAVLTTAPEAVPVGADDQTTAGPATLDTTQTPSESTAAPETGSTLAATQEARTDAQQTTEAVTSGPATDQVSSIATAVPTDTQTPEQTAESATIFQTVTDTRAPAVPKITVSLQF
ncbi:hypothetical protein SKAU_G00104930 [Synaphobranchus kaupii]|uniref:Uncharacterized protein n=1 Tax=Synaphobranchus kaupii TaxID=118154 RepID=A0A9Q1G057_SYNKA|nr:hypothetical protein SKAU_G00104930 [Synaphobranchus kaupii]